MTLKTEDEARQCFCPMVRPEYLQGSPFSRMPLCIASGCMAWRWAYSDPATDVHTGETYPPEQLPTGYCGMAGKP